MSALPQSLWYISSPYQTVDSIFKHLLDGVLVLSKNCVSIFFLFLITILSYTLISLTSQLETPKLMTSQICSHVKYLIQTYNIIVLIYYEIDEKLNLMDGFNTI